jgi:flagellar hook-associated protein 2
LQLRTTAGDSGSNILTSANQGTNAEFKLNGLQFSRSDNVVTDAIDGLTFTIVDETAVGETVVLTLASSRGSVASALQDLVSAYNDVRGSINQHMGENAGLLSGDAVLRQMQSVLQKITGHQGSGTIKSLAQLGISLDKTGVMSFDSSVFYALSSTSFQASFDLLGSPSTGLGALASSVEQLSDPVTGLIKTQQNNYDLADTRISKTITEMAERIERMQLTLSAKLQQADVLLSTLQSQQDTLTAALQSLSVISFGKQEK